MRKETYIYLIIIILLLGILLGLIVGKLKFEMDIQTFSILILVCITAYYAIQTHKLSSETTKQRNLDFLERVIRDMHAPLVHKLLEVEKAVIKLPSSQGQINSEAINAPNIREKIEEVNKLFSKIDYSFPGEYRDKLRKWLKYLKNLRESRTNASRTEFLNYSKDLTSDINKSKLLILEILRREYVSGFLRKQWNKQIKERERKTKKAKNRK